ncbi:potassium channel subfamily K member 16-like [Ornithodoros turicata]|uniref:potassium channel subfamily K member 16-like n=1 Tax=Ornithodoros turicata TaxID=34597 RepID=UPI003138C4FC
MSRTPSPRAGRRPPFLSQPSLISWQSDPSRPPQYFVVRPMHIVNLTADKTKSCAVRCAQAIKSFSQRWFSHLLLLLVLLAYAALGAAIFQLIEAPFEQRQKETILNMRKYIVDVLAMARISAMDQHAFKNLVTQRMREFESQVRLLEDEASIYTHSEKKVWSFWGALFYCGTVFTTIGYGNIAPSTLAGRAVTVLYAFIGIPLLLMVLADLGKLFTRGIKAVFVWGKHFYRTGRCRRKRRGTEVEGEAKAPIQYVAFVWRKVNDTMAYVPYPAYLRSEGDKPDAKPEENGKSDDVDVEKSAEPNNEEEEDEGVDDEFNLPVSLALILLSLYMTIGACLFTIWESWTFHEAFYFVFISMSTIGFGDYVPDHPMFMMATFIYLLFGLALTSMCINVVQEKLSAIFERARMQLGTSIGFDPALMMAESPTAPPRRGSKADALDDKADDKAGDKDADKHDPKAITAK